MLMIYFKEIYLGKISEEEIIEYIEQKYLNNNTLLSNMVVL